MSKNKHVHSFRLPESSSIEILLRRLAMRVHAIGGAHSLFGLMDHHIRTYSACGLAGSITLTIPASAQRAYRAREALEMTIAPERVLIHWSMTSESRTGQDGALVNLVIRYDGARCSGVLTKHGRLNVFQRSVVDLVTAHRHT